MCGIMAISPKNGNKINWARVKLLLLANETRGRHSTGLYTKNASLKMVQSASTFIKSLTINHEEELSPLLGHTRAPSAGADRTINGAQPIIETDENGDTDFAIIHNGTIHNMEALADEEDIEYEKTDTDTQILAKFIKAEKYDVLSKYLGAASLIWHRMDDPEAVYVFRGESPQSSYTTYASEERPLHIGEDETGIYISSTKDSLVEMFDTKEQKESVRKVEANTIFRIAEGEEVIVQTVSRKDVSQSKLTTTYSSSSNNYHRHQNPYSYGYDSDYYEPTSKTTASLKGDAYGRMGYSNVIPLWISTISEVAESKLLVEETIKATALGNNEVFFYKGRYRTKNIILNGAIHINDKNMLSTKSGDNVKQYKFVKGVLLKDDSEFVKVYSALGQHNFGSQQFCDAIMEYSKQPIPVLETYQDIAIETFYMNGRLFSGVYEPLFKKRGIVEIHAGYLAATVFYPVTDILVGSRIRAKVKNSYYAGKVILRNIALGIVTIETAYGETKRISDSDIIDVFTSIKDAISEKVSLTPKEVEAKAKKEKAEADAAAKIAREAMVKKIKSDTQSVLKDSHEELNTAILAAKNEHVKLPRIVKRVYNLLGHATSSLNNKSEKQ